MVKFSKNGSTATTAAVKLARAYTGRKLVAFPTDHPFYSYDDWFIGKTKCNRGVPEEVSDLELITHEELLEIRRIWVLEKHEREDMLPVIYEKSTGERFLDTGTVDDSFPFNSNDLKELIEKPQI